MQTHNIPMVYDAEKEEWQTLWEARSLRVTLKRPLITHQIVTPAHDWVPQKEHWT